MAVIRILTSVLLLGLPLLAGCAAASGGFPRRSVNEQENIDVLAERFASSVVIADYHQLKGDPETTEADLRAKRSEIVNGRMALVDAHFRVFVREFVVEKQGLDTATDVSVIGLNSAAALIDPTSTTQILAGIAAGLTGAKASFDKNFYYEQTVKALYAAMTAQRTEVRLRMLAGLEQSTTRYPLERALSDLNDYYFAGTFIGALQAIQKDAGVKETRAQDRIDDITGLGERVMEGREQALRIIEADVDLARRRLVEWYRSLPPGSPDRVAARAGILAVVDPVPGAILTDGQPDPEKWLGADPGVPAEHRATADQLAAWVAGLMNPVRSDAERFKGELIPILLGKG